MKIRQAGEDDLDAIRIFVNESKPLDLHTPFSYWILLRYFHDTCFVMEEGGRIVGYASGLAAGSPDGVFFFWQIGIAPEHRGRGHAFALIERMAAAAGEKGCRAMHVTIEPENKASFRAFSGFSKKMGLPMKRIGAVDFLDSLSNKWVFEDLYEIGLQPTGAPSEGGVKQWMT